MDLKKIHYKYVSIDDIDPEEFKNINPYAQVPALQVSESQFITQSQAIIQFLDEFFPNSFQMLPQDPLERAKVRMISDAIVSGIQPLQNPAVLEMMNHLQERAGQAFAENIINMRFNDLELMLARTSGKFCVGNNITMADAVLVPQVYNAITRFNIDVDRHYPLIARIYHALEKIPSFSSTHPEKMPDAPKHKVLPTK